MKLRRIRALISNKNKTTFLIEFVSTFTAVVLAFALNNWNQERRDRNAEREILKALSAGIKKDKLALQYNLEGHKDGIIAVNEMKNMINNKSYNKDSILEHYDNLFQSYIFSTNNTAYKTMTSKGLDIIKSDSLRTYTFHFYEYYFNMLMKAEESFDEYNLYKNYFHDINNILYKHMYFDEEDRLQGFVTPFNLTKTDKKYIYSYFYQMKRSRNERINMYNYVLSEFDSLDKLLEKKLHEVQ